MEFVTAQYRWILLIRKDKDNSFVQGYKDYPQITPAVDKSRSLGGSPYGEWSIVIGSHAVGVVWREQREFTF